MARRAALSHRDPACAAPAGGAVMIVLGIESSCDETGVALVDAASGDAATPRLLGHALHSQVDMHRAYGGVVPELASRDHIRRVLPLTRAVLAEAGVESLARATEAFAAERMNRGIRNALAGRRIEDV